jgi:hypothetical protein
MEIQQFKAKLFKPDAVGSWTYVTVPFQATEVFESRARIPVKGTINGVPYRGSLIPHGDGRHYMVVNKTLQKNCGASNGELVELTMMFDDEERTVEIPGDLDIVLTLAPDTKKIFTELAYSHQSHFLTNLPLK